MAVVDVRTGGTLVPGIRQLKGAVVGLLMAGHERMGERLRMVNPLNDMETEVEVVSPHFVDPQGERLRG